MSGTSSEAQGNSNSLGIHQNRSSIDSVLAGKRVMCCCVYTSIVKCIT